MGKAVEKGYVVTLRVRIRITEKGLHDANVGYRIHNKNTRLTPFQVAKRRIAALWFDAGIDLVEVSELED